VVVAPLVDILTLCAQPLPFYSPESGILAKRKPSSVSANLQSLSRPELRQQVDARLCASAAGFYSYLGHYS